MSDQPEVTLIIGAGLGGVSAAGALRGAGNTGRIVLINGEAELPYDRPPLSKGVIQGSEALEDVYLKPESWYVDNGVELLSNTRVVKIAPDSHQLELADGSTLAYDKLLLASGADVRRIPSLEQDQVPFHYLRDFRDAEALQEGLEAGKHLVLVGAGVIGLEVAASARKIGCEVAVVEIVDRVMARSMPANMSAWLQQQHEDRGVKFFLENSIAEFQQEGGETSLLLSGGERIPVDLMLICAGVIPAVQLAEDCGIECDNGVVVDEHCHTSNEDIYAIGDVASYPDAWAGKQMRSENWMHAQRQAECAALNMNGEASSYADIQSVWTDQYEFKLQMAGILAGEQEVMRGDMSSGSFMIFYLDEGTVVGVLGVNQPKQMRIAQNIIKSRAQADVDMLADSDANLKKATR
jgi:3-phenylpropionate/trans-cinnamate dioxygenase ferredoxin reductase component